ncbi:MAG: exo-beta-N-acetylmuramidase NamZ family protein [Thermodesulfobacteriota bacterium]
MISLGIEQLLVDPPVRLKGKRLGLLCNQASTDRHFRHSRDLIHAAFPDQLTCLFTPQHGFYCEKQDNMIESEHMRDRITGLPVYSLYGETRKPTREMFEQLDVLLVDIVDVGTRVYTFMYTLAYCLQAAVRSGKKVVVLDRPNPIGGEMIEGNLVDDDLRSFVGLYPIPMRHGLTFGELGRLFNDHFGIKADYEVIPMAGWRRSMTHEDTGLPWLFPSPNMPSALTAAVYPGQVIWEGTNISEGRGTTLPFELFGAPFVEPARVLEHLDHSLLAGCFLRPISFLPTAGKWQGQDCAGFHLHVTDKAAFRPYRVSLALLQAVMRLYPDDFALKAPPYEYEFEKCPLDLILGSGKVRNALAAGEAIADIESGWHDDLRRFDEMRRSCFLY